MSVSLAQRYAKALYEICEGTGELRDVYRDIEAMGACLAGSEEFKDFIGNNALPRSRQEALLRALFRKKITDTTMIFLLFLVNKSRLHILPQICSAFESMVLASQNIIQATIISSMPLDENQIGAIKKHLADKLNKEIQEKVIINEKLIGGVKVCVGDEIYDYTVQAQLEEFRSNFSKAVI